MPCKPAKASVEGQPFPAKAKGIVLDGAFPDSDEITLGGNAIGSISEVFAYVLTTVELRAGRFIQHGCGPNFQGDRITLCTCMNFHRTWPRFKTGMWVAGLTNLDSHNCMFYLMRVERTFDSFAAMWRAPLPFPRIADKSAARDDFGDIYEPRTALSGAAMYTPANYKVPTPKHKHMPTAWKNDIGFRRPTAAGPQPHKLLLGKPGNSYLWTQPALRYANPPHSRFRFYDSLAAFRKVLK